MGLFTWLTDRLPSRAIYWDVGSPRYLEEEEETEEEKVINVKLRVKKMLPLANVSKRWGKNNLVLKFSKYIASDYMPELKRSQALQTCLHELFHIVLWSNKKIEHSEDTSSIIYSIIDGKTLEPTEWDILTIKKAAKDIDYIDLDPWGAPLSESVFGTDIYMVLVKAVKYWNNIVGKRLFRFI